MATKQISLPTIGTVTLYKRRGNRSLRLSIDAGGEIRVSMPYWLPYKAGEQFALSKSAWIAAHKVAPPTGLQHGQVIGKAHRLVFAPSAQALTVSTRLKQNEIEVSHPFEYTAHHPRVQQAARSASIRALRKEAEQLLPIRLRQLAERTGFSYNSVGVKQLKSRWGSCTSTQDITLNLFLMQLPWHLIDYVLLHELTHTKVMRHGAPFWRELELHVPHAKRLRKEIGTYHPVLAGR
ncbi:MAG TPA: SprT family zinc-dependent metalloprotease [Candidatus Saccharimonadales bacterium]|nr:SprT family zinc-dependent metalloprotease [Candidatus Saccharimonadales bacterium]